MLDTEKQQFEAQHETVTGDTTPEYGSEHGRNKLGEKLEPTKTGGTLDKIETENYFGEGALEQKWTTKIWLAYIAMGFIWVGSQIPLYFVGGSLQYITEDLGGADRAIWLSVANTLALGAICPFTGYMSDIFGRKWVSLFGSGLLCVGVLIVPLVNSMNYAIAGMALAGAGAGICEMTALAGASEMVPHRHRGIAIGALILCILPFCPYIMYSELLSRYHSWRWGLWIVLIWNGIGFIMVLCFYNPPKHVLTQSRTEILKKIDYLGGLLSIGGVTNLLLALQWGGSQYPWGSARVIITLILGFGCLIGFGVWEYFAPYPMIPTAISSKDARVLSLTFGITFVSGMSFFSFLNFLPVIVRDMYDSHNPIQVGTKAIGAGIATALAAGLISIAMSLWPGKMREMVVFSTTVMTVGSGCICALTPDTPHGTIVTAIITGFGIGGIVIPAATIAVIAAPSDMIATIAALTLAIRTIGGSIGNSIYFNVLDQRLAQDLPTRLAGYVIRAGLPPASAVEFITAYLGGNTTGLAVIPGVTAAVIEAAADSVRWSYAYAIHWVFYVTIPFGTVAVIMALFLGDLSKYKNHGMDVH